MELTEKPVVRTLIIFLVLIVVSMLASLYLVASLDHILAFPQISISDTYTRDPTRATAAYMMSLSAFVFLLVSLSRLNRMFPFVYRQADIWVFSALILGVVFLFISICAVGAVPLTTEYSVHIIAAVTLFISGGLAILAVTWLDDRLDFDRPQSLRIFRILITCLVLLSGIALAVTSEIADASAGILEIVIVVLFLLYIGSWLHESEFPLVSKSLPERLTPLQADLSVPPV